MSQNHMLLDPGCLAGLPTQPARADDFDLKKTKEVLEAKIEKLLAQGVASVSIALVRGDEIVWKAAYGYMNVRMKVPATPETIYGTCSTFKAVTATALLQLVEAGRAALDDPVNKYLGDARVKDRTNEPVTVRHILCHASGLNAGANAVNLWQRQLPATLAELTAKLRAVRAPRKKYEYNNYAYGMAGLLIEKLSRQSYEDYIVEKILRPLGIETPGPVHPTPEMVERLALPYLPGPGRKPRPVAQIRFDVYPAGDIYLTAEDMARFLAAHINGGLYQGRRILSEASVAEAHRVQFGNYGLGWGIFETGGCKIIHHRGGVLGFCTAMIGDLDAKVGAYVMSNSGDVGEIGLAALKLLRGEE